MTSKLFKRLLSPRFFRFAAVGLSGVVINLSMLFLFADLLDIQEVISSACAIEISIIWNFLLNNSWTFRDRNEGASAGFGNRMYRYHLVSLVGAGIQLGTFVALTRFFVFLFDLSATGNWIYPAQMVGIGLAMTWNFLTNFFWTWAQRRKPDEADVTEAPDTVAESTE